VFGSHAPNTRVATRASTRAPAHIVHGSNVTTSVQPSRRHSPRAWAARRNAMISAWAVGSPTRSRSLRPLASSTPSESKTTAPTGTSPVGCADAASADASAGGALAACSARRIIASYRRSRSLIPPSRIMGPRQALAPERGGLGLAQLLHLVPASDRLAQLGRDVRGEHALLGTQFQQSARRHP